MFWKLPSVMDIQFLRGYYIRPLFQNIILWLVKLLYLRFSVFIDC